LVTAPSALAAASEKQRKAEKREEGFYCLVSQPANQQSSHQYWQRRESREKQGRGKKASQPTVTILAAKRRGKALKRRKRDKGIGRKLKLKKKWKEERRAERAGKRRKFDCLGQNKKGKKRIV
jgi:hypothetical protein